MMGLHPSLALREFGEGLTHDEELTIREAVKTAALTEGAKLRVIQLLRSSRILGLDPQLGARMGRRITSM